VSADLKNKNCDLQPKTRKLLLRESVGQVGNLSYRFSLFKGVARDMNDSYDGSTE